MEYFKFYEELDRAETSLVRGIGTVQERLLSAGLHIVRIKTEDAGVFDERVQALRETLLREGAVPYTVENMSQDEMVEAIDAILSLVRTVRSKK